jgi:hypothetical protein
LMDAEKLELGRLFLEREQSPANNDSFDWFFNVCLS